MAASLRPFTDRELAAYMSEGFTQYIAQRVASDEPPEAARRIAAEQHERYFPGGLPADGHALFAVLDESGAEVGRLWLGPHPDAIDGVAWIYDIEIDAAWRGRGWGRATLALAEQRAAASGYVQLGLNVFGGNEAARNLYRSTGFREVSVQMTKDLGPGSAAT